MSTLHSPKIETFFDCSRRDEEILITLTETLICSHKWVWRFLLVSMRVAMFSYGCFWCWISKINSFVGKLMENVQNKFWKSCATNEIRWMKLEIEVIVTGCLEMSFSAWLYANLDALDIFEQIKSFGSRVYGYLLIFVKFHIGKIDLIYESMFESLQQIYI